MVVPADRHFGELEESGAMALGRQTSPSHRYAVLAAQMNDPEFRDSYGAAHTREFLARQIRSFRGEKSQEEFGDVIAQKQSAVSRLENPNYGRETLQTCFDIAAKLGVMFVARFVDLPTFLKITGDMSESAVHPEPYNQEKLDDFVRATTDLIEA